MKFNKGKPKTRSKPTRKQQRKEMRKQKKQRRNEYYTNRNKPDKSALNSQQNTKDHEENQPVYNLKKKKGKQNIEDSSMAKNQVPSTEHLRKKEQRQQRKLETQMKKQRKKQLIEANKEEDHIIKQLEKQLGLNKRKSKNLPKGFADEGLDYLLEVCDPERMKNAIGTEKELNENCEFYEDFALMSGMLSNSDEETKSDFQNESDLEKELSSESNIEDDHSDSEDGESASIGKDCESEIDENTLSNKRNKKQQSSSKKRKKIEHDNSDNEEIADEDLDNDCNSEQVMFKLPSNKKKRKEKAVKQEVRSSGPKKKEQNKKRIEQEILEDDFSDLENLSNEEEVIESRMSKKKNKKAEQETLNEFEGGNFHDFENVCREDDGNENEVRTIKGAIKINPDGTWEDIYGRLRDKSGAVITKKEEALYIPPAMREKLNSTENSKRNEKLLRLKRQLKGLLNRLAERNMHNITMQIEDLYMNNSRNDMNDTLTNLMMESLVTEIITPERLLIEHVALLTILHANIGIEIGAHFLQYIVQWFNKLLQTHQNVENKTLDNIVNILTQMYNFKIFDSKLMYEIIAKLAEGFKEKDIECILHILKSIGFILRKDDPFALKNLILDLQKRAANVKHEEKEDPRVKFMLDILLAIKNNNVTKIPNYDVSYSEHLKKILKGHIRKGHYVTQLNISLEDLLRAEERGKWWIVGSAWTGDRENLENNMSEKTTGNSSGYSVQLLELARKQRMNTDNRRNIFCIIMSAEDYLDAFEKLLKLGLKNQQDREIISVILHCCLQEKKYNPYYAHLAQKLCDYDRRYQMTIKYSIWDKVKVLDSHSGSQISNLAKLLTHLFIEKGLPITTLKVVQFSELDKLTLRFIRQILIGILLHENQEACLEVFAKVTISEKLKLFRESLRPFIHHFLLRNVKTDGSEEQTLLEDRAKTVERFLASKGTNLLNV